jgi:ADP-heptose:LPS heptosyltransferase
MEGNICYIPVSIGELFDKYTILQIKQNRIKDAKKLEIVGKELFYLKQFIDTYKLEEKIVDELKGINETLWDVEDKIREKEKDKRFDEEFVKLARNVYITNDKRSETKNKINAILKSGLHEVKSYSKYTDDNIKETININIGMPEPSNNLNSFIPVKPIINNTTTKTNTSTNTNTKTNTSKNTNTNTNTNTTTNTKSKGQKIDEINKHIEKLSNTLNYNELIDNYNKLIELDTLNTNKYLRTIGETYEKQNMFQDAADCYEKILKTEKHDFSTIGVLTNQVGVCYHNLKKHEIAINYFKKVLLIKEINDVYCNISTCYVSLRNYKEAEYFLLKSYNLNNNDYLTNDLLGNLYYYIKKYDKSIEYYTKNKIDKNNHKGNFSLSFTYLAQKKFKTGFTLYENRLYENKSNLQTGLKDRVDIPGLDDWNGKDICNRLLVVYEQGIGDNIQMYRFIIELSEKYPNMKIDYFCRELIQNIFHTYNNIQFVKDVNIQDYDYKLYIMSLPKILNLKSIEPNKINYIKTHQDTLTFWKKKTSSLKKFKVGFVYNGLLSSFIEKYIPLQEYEKLCDLDIELICIHKKSEVEDDLKNISFRDKIIHYDIDNNEPFEDTIHLLQNIDLLITVDTYIAHLAGVLNVKTWLLLGTSEWRWSDDINKTYWYNSVELIRTKENEKLKDLIKTVKDKLIILLKSYTPTSHLK